MTTQASTSVPRNSLSNLQDASSFQMRVFLEGRRPRPRLLSPSRHPRRAKYPRQKSRIHTRSHQLSTNTTGPSGDHVRPVSAAMKSTSQETHERKSWEPSEVISKLEFSDYHSTGRRVPGNCRMLLDRPRCIPKPLATSGTEPWDRMTDVDEITGNTNAISSPTMNCLLNCTNPDSHTCTANTEGHSSDDAEKPASGLARGTSSVPRPREVDSLLVEAITRSVAQQFRLLSVGSFQGSDERDIQYLGERRPGSPRSSSRTSSQRVALDHFVQELQRCVGYTGAKDITPPFTPTPTWPDATVRTISALLPFRSEFTAAGLAVTSNDQAKMHTRHTRAGVVPRTRTPFPRPSISGTQLGQLDGNDGNPSSRGEVVSDVAKSMNEWRNTTTHQAISNRQQDYHENNATEAQCLPCVPSQTNRSGIWGCLQLMQKSEPRLLTSKPTTKRQDFGAYFESTMPKLPATSSAPGRANPVPPHVVCPPQHQHDTSINIKQLFSEAEKVQLGKKHSVPVFFSGPHRSVSLSHLHQDPIGLLRQDQNSGLPENHYSITESNLAKPDGGLGKTLRLVHSSKELSQHQRRTDIPRKRYRSAPMHGISKDVRSIDTDINHMLDLAWTPQNMVDDGSNIDWVTELANKPSIKNKSHKEATKSLSRKDDNFFELPSSPQHVALCSRGHPIFDLVRPSIPQRISSIQEKARVTKKESEIIDRDVLRGLHIATSAACDEKIDAFISAKTGLRIRRFLADLMLFENLSHGADEQWAEKRVEMKRAKRRAKRAQRAKTAGLVSY